VTAGAIARRPRSTAAGCEPPANSFVGIGPVIVAANRSSASPCSSRSNTEGTKTRGRDGGAQAGRRSRRRPSGRVLFAAFTEPERHGHHIPMIIGERGS